MAVDEREFIDMLYAGWAKTTDAEHSYWQPEEMVNNPGQFKVYAVTVDPETGDESRKLVATQLSEEDAAFITAIHGSFGDIVRRTLEAYDETDRADEALDSQIVRVAELEMLVDELMAGGGRDGAAVE